MTDPGTLTANTASWNQNKTCFSCRVPTQPLSYLQSQTFARSAFPASGANGHDIAHHSFRHRFFAVVVGFVVETINDKMEGIKKGRTTFVETGHTLIPNWTDRTIFLVMELCEAFHDHGGGVIVLLSEASKEAIETEIEMQIANTKGTRIVVRTGSPLVMQDSS